MAGSPRSWLCGILRGVAIRAWRHANRFALLPAVDSTLVRMGVGTAGSTQPSQHGPQWSWSGSLDHPPAAIHRCRQGLQTHFDADRSPTPTSAPPRSAPSTWSGSSSRRTWPRRQRSSIGTGSNGVPSEPSWLPSGGHARRYVTERARGGHPWSRTLGSPSLGSFAGQNPWPRPGSKAEARVNHMGRTRLAAGTFGNKGGLRDQEAGLRRY
jgi:hypothetical protein